MTRVLPVPGPATISRGPLPCRMALICSGFSSSMKLTHYSAKLLVKARIDASSFLFSCIRLLSTLKMTLISLPRRLCEDELHSDKLANSVTIRRHFGRGHYCGTGGSWDRLFNSCPSCPETRASH